MPKYLALVQIVANLVEDFIDDLKREAATVFCTRSRKDLTITEWAIQVTVVERLDVHNIWRRRYVRLPSSVG